MSDFANELEREIRAAADDLRRQMNAPWIVPPGAYPPVPWRKRVWRRLRYRVTEVTSSPRRWVARRIYDFEVHEDRW